MPSSLLLTTALLCAPAAPLPDDAAAEILEDAKRLLRQKKDESAVELLRRLLREFPDGDSSKTGAQLLAARGYGPNIHVIFKEDRALRRAGVSAAKVVNSLETKLARLRIFFEQTFSQLTPLKLDLEVIVFDSQSRFRSAYPPVMRRSALAIDQAGKKGEKRARVAVYFDSRIAKREDSVDLLEKGVIREITVLLLRSSAKTRLPAALETGLCEYLAVRLFPRKLTAIARTQEAILKGHAREGLRKVEHRTAFRDHLTSSDPERSRAPAIAARWRGLSYALFDSLLSADLSKEQEKKQSRTDRILKFQSLLRDYDDLAHENKVPLEPKPRLALLNRVLLRHLGFGVDALHDRFLRRVRRYPPSPPDYEGITD